MAYTDEEIKQVILDQLSWDNRIGWSEVDVQVYDGEVTLEGMVASFVAREAAEADTLQIPGVVKVNNHMVIRFPGGAQVPSDGEIQTRILNRYLWNPNIPASDIDVTVSHGEVILKGSVDEYWKKMHAEEVAYDIGGVVHVSNDLVVVPSHEYGDMVIASGIMSAMERDSDIDQERIELDVDNGRVTLNGVVSSVKEVAAIYRVARFTRGVRDVINLLKVQKKAA